MTASFAAAVDIGSTSIKGAVIDLDRASLAEVVSEPFPQPLTGLPQRHFEVDPSEVVGSVTRVINELLARQPRCAVLHMCTQMGGVVLVDQAGSAITNYLSWRDERSTLVAPGGTLFEQLLGRIDPVHRRELGNEIKPGTALSLLFALSQQAELPSGAIPLGIGDFVLWRLTGSCPPLDPTAAMGLVDVASLGWHKSIFEKLGLGQLKWPRLGSVRNSCGRLAFAPHCVCYPAIGDHQAALLGTMLLPRELSINISTGSQTSLVTDHLMSGDYQTRPFFEGRYLNTITHLPAGRSLNVLVQLLTEIARAQGVNLGDPWQYIASEASRVPDKELVVDLSFFDGPMGSEGSMSHITVDNLSVGTLFRAAFRNMADNYGLCAKRLAPQGAWDRIVLSGGLAKIEVLRQFLARRFDCPMRTFEAADETLLGLMVLACVVTGRAPSIVEGTLRLRAAMV